MDLIFLNSSDLLEHPAMMQMTRNKLLTEKLLKQGYRYHKLHKTFLLNFYADSMILYLNSMSDLNIQYMLLVNGSD